MPTIYVSLLHYLHLHIPCNANLGCLVLPLAIPYRALPTNSILPDIFGEIIDFSHYWLLSNKFKKVDDDVLGFGAV
jgi:hypothetical protein